MAKEIPNVFDKLAEKKGGATPDRRTADKQPTKDVQTTDEQPTTDTPMERYQVRLRTEDYHKIKAAFNDQGLSFSAGIRMLIKQYLSKIS